MTGKEKAKEEMLRHYSETKHNTYPRVKLKRVTGVTVEELKELEQEGFLFRARGIRDTLFCIKEFG